MTITIPCAVIGVFAGVCLFFAGMVVGICIAGYCLEVEK